MKWFRYVKHDEIAAYEAKGWRVSDNLQGTNHGHFAVLMIYEGDHEPD